MKAPYLAVYRASGISVVRARHSLDESSQDLTTFYSKSDRKLQSSCRHCAELPQPQPRFPLLLSGGQDHVSPASVVEANFKLYCKSKAVTEYTEFPERTHYTLGQPGWEEVADCVLGWAANHTSKSDIATRRNAPNTHSLILPYRFKLTREAAA